MTAIEKLGEKGFRTVYVDLRDKPNWYGQIYDKLTVPSIQYGDFKLGDSIPCCKWMNNKIEAEGNKLLSCEKLDELVTTF